MRAVILSKWTGSFFPLRLMTFIAMVCVKASGVKKASARFPAAREVRRWALAVGLVPKTRVVKLSGGVYLADRRAGTRVEGVVAPTRGARSQVGGAFESLPACAHRLAAFKSSQIRSIRSLR